MAKKAKTVGQMLAALAKAAEGKTIDITFEDGKYYVGLGVEDSTFGPTLYGAFRRLGERLVERNDAAISKLRGRVGA